MVIYRPPYDIMLVATQQHILISRKYFTGNTAASPCLCSHMMKKINATIEPHKSPIITGDPQLYFTPPQLSAISSMTITDAKSALPRISSLSTCFLKGTLECASIRASGTRVRTNASPVTAPSGKLM